MKLVSFTALFVVVVAALLAPTTSAAVLARSSNGFVRNCTSQIDCFNHAASVSGNTQTGCTCFCRNSWSGKQCENCAAKYNMNEDCGTCAAGHDSYPSCYRTCTIERDCFNHAYSVTGNVNTGCTCACRNQWTGYSCVQCPWKFDAAKDCGACAEGRADYPTCTKKEPNDACTLADCHYRAMNVSGTKGNCKCLCLNAWAGDTCQTCPAGFDKNNFCGSCSEGYGGYPNCKRFCTVEQDCNNHATAVTGFAGNCNCKCRNFWEGTFCGVCPKERVAASDCLMCNPTAYNQTGWPPVCTPKKAQCTNAHDCSGHASIVSGVVGDCNCKCENSWTGASCQYCAANYNQADNCASCAAGFDSYPSCFRTCTVAQDCASHATSVTGNVNTGCNCACRNFWTGVSCSVCPHNYDATIDCAACASGYTDFPKCVPIS